MFNFKPLKIEPVPEAYIRHSELDSDMTDLIRDRIFSCDLIPTYLGDGDFCVNMSWNIFQKAFKQDLTDMRDEEEDKNEPHFLKDFMNSFPLEYKQNPDKLFSIEFIY